MGLFIKAKNYDIEQEVLQRMMHSGLLDYLIDILINKPEMQWMTVGKHGDHGWRKVIVEPSGFIIEKPRAYERHDENGFVAINFEAAGYNRIEAHCNTYGKTDISRSRMCYLYATALQKRLQAVMKNCEFSPVTNNRDLSKVSDENMLFTLGDILIMDAGARAEFSYRVPVPVASNLF